MTVGVWDPVGSGSKTIDVGLLQRFLELARRLSEPLPEPLPGPLNDAALDAADLTKAHWVMRLDASAWQLAGQLKDDDLISLVRLFTLLERDLSGWDAGSKSPVIPLVKLLKARGSFDPALRKWIKANTSNRYLPHGSAI